MNKFLIINCSKKVLKHYVMIKDYFSKYIFISILYFFLSIIFVKSQVPQADILKISYFKIFNSNNGEISM